MNSSPTVVAIILTYWPKRTKNVDQIVKDLENSTRPPDLIMVWNNNKDHQFKYDDPSIMVVNSQYNFTSRAKYAAAMLYPADYYLLIDDDISVGKKTIENLMTYADPTSCISFNGVRLRESDKSFGYGEQVKSENISAVENVDSHIGRLYFCSWASLCNLFFNEYGVRVMDKQYIFEGDDILIGLLNNSTVIPAKGDELPYDLDEGGQSMSIDGGGIQYIEMRDEFTKHALRFVV